MRNSLKLAAVLVAVTATSASAQSRGRNDDGIPPGQRPAAGMCRIWINGVPPGQQPAATDCATARANLPANARIIVGRNTNGRNVASNRTFTRRRQLSNGSWVLDRLTRDANGNLVVLSTSPLVTGNGVNVGRRGDDNEGNDDRKAEKRDRKDERKAEKREMKGDRKNDKRDDKGRKEKDDDDNDDDNG
jgi:hypothetical protein